MFNFCNNPITALTVGWIFTVIISSSSTTTSICVAMCSAHAIPLSTAVYIIMGSNIGTALEGVIVSYGYVKNAVEFRRAASGATVNDMFNLYSVLLFLPIEWIWGIFNNKCGLFCTIATATTKAIGGGSADASFPSPLDFILDPFCELFIEINKDVYKAYSFGCGVDSPKCTPNDALLNQTNLGCFDGESVCILSSDWHNKYDSQSIIKSSFIKSVWKFSDIGTGVFLLILAVVCIIIFLILLVWVLQFLVLGKANKYLKKALNMNPYLGMLIGCVLTIVLQSSSVVTSSLVPLVGVGVLSVEGILPVTLGANVGTTFTAIIAGLSTGELPGLSAAFVHVYYNIIGIIVFYPIKMIRRILVNSSYLFGKTIQKFRWFGVAYIVVLYIIIPIYLLLVSILIGEGGNTIWWGISMIIISLLLISIFVMWLLLFGGKTLVTKLIDKTKNKTPEEIALAKGIEFPVEDCLEYNPRSKKWRVKVDKQKKMLEQKKKLEEMERGIVIIESEIKEERIIYEICNTKSINNTKQCE